MTQAPDDLGALSPTGGTGDIPLSTVSTDLFILGNRASATIHPYYRDARRLAWPFVLTRVVFDRFCADADVRTAIPARLMSVRILLRKAVDICAAQARCPGLVTM